MILCYNYKKTGFDMYRFVKSCLLTVGASCSLLFAGGDLGVYEPKIVLPISSNFDCDSGCPKESKLMWQDTSYGDKSDAAYNNNDSSCKAGTYEYAKSYCENLSFGGFSDWRLPTSDELMGASKIKNFFSDNRGADFWTSTQVKNGKHYVVFTVDGFRYAREDSQSNYIRCVRCTTGK